MVILKIDFQVLIDLLIFYIVLKKIDLLCIYYIMNAYNEINVNVFQIFKIRIYFF